jgi:MFS family permease
MRRLVLLVSVILYLDAALFGALIPLLPGFADAYQLSKLESGLLFAAYGAGAVLGGIPAGFLSSRIGPRNTVAAGFVVMTLAMLTFALADDPVTLGVARLVQGLASIATWSGSLAWIAVETPRERRGQTLGIVFGVAVFGFIAGPVIGAIAELTSLRLTFLSITGAALALAVATALQPPPRPEERRPGALRRAVSDPRFLAGLWLSMLPAFFFGVLDVLATLDLDAGGFGVVALTAVFVVAGLVETGFNPLLGRLSDQRGRLFPIRYALGASIVVAAGFAATSNPYLVAVLVVAASLSFGGFYTPGMALVADRAEAAGLAQGLGFGINNTVWAVGAMLGPVAGGSLADVVGDAVPYGLGAALCALTFVIVVRRAPPGRGQAPLRRPVRR